MRRRHGIGGQGLVRGSLSGLLAELLESRTLLAAVAWDGGGDGSSWSDPRNWSADVLPSVGDDVSIAPGYGTVRVGSGVPELGSLDARSALEIYSGGLSAIGRLSIGAASRITAAAQLQSRSGLLEVNADLDIGDAALVLRGDMVGLTAAIRGQAGSSVSAFGRALDLGGLVRAGLIHIEAVPSGQTSVHGVLDADAFGTGTGGTIRILGGGVSVDGAAISASGPSGGGQINIGGNRLGQGPLQNARVTGVSSTSVVRADATQNGNAGQIIVWADEATGFYATASARGGSAGGNGGFIETSAAWLDVVGASVDVGAPAGNAGEWLLDPWNITISAAATQGGTFQNGQFTPSGFGANIQASAISAALSGGTNVVINTAGGGPEAGDVDMNAVINKTGPLQATLTIIANNDIRVSSTIAGTTFPLDVNLNAGGTITNVAPIQTSGGNIAMVASAVSIFSPISSVGGGGSGTITVQSTLAYVEILAAVNAGNAEVLLQAEGAVTLVSSVTGGLVTLLGSGVMQGVIGGPIQANQLEVRAISGNIQLGDIDNQINSATLEAATSIFLVDNGGLSLVGGVKPAAVIAGEDATIEVASGVLSIEDDLQVEGQLVLSGRAGVNLNSFAEIRGGTSLRLESIAGGINLGSPGIVLESDRVSLVAGTQVQLSGLPLLRNSLDSENSPTSVLVSQGQEISDESGLLAQSSFAGGTDGLDLTYESSTAITLLDAGKVANANLALIVNNGGVVINTGSPMSVESVDVDADFTLLRADILATFDVTLAGALVDGSALIQAPFVTLFAADGASPGEDSLHIIANELILDGDVGSANALLSFHATVDVSIQLPESIRAGSVTIDGTAQAAAVPGSQIIAPGDVTLLTPVVSLSAVQPGDLLIQADNIIIQSIGDANFGTVELRANGYISLGASITALEVELQAFEIVLSSDLAIQLRDGGNDFIFDGLVQSDGPARSITATLPGTGVLIFSQPVGSFNPLRSITIVGQADQPAVVFRSNVSLTDEIIVQGNVSFDVGVSLTATTVDFQGDVGGLDGGSVELLATSGLVKIGGDVGSSLNPMAALTIIGELDFGGTRIDAQNISVNGVITLRDSAVFTISDGVTLSGGVRGSGTGSLPSFTLALAASSNVVLGPVGSDEPGFELQSVTISGSLNPISLVGAQPGVRARNLLVTNQAFTAGGSTTFSAPTISWATIRYEATDGTLRLKTDQLVSGSSQISINSIVGVLLFQPFTPSRGLEIADAPTQMGVLYINPQVLDGITGFSTVSFGNAEEVFGDIRIATSQVLFGQTLFYTGPVSEILVDSTLTSSEGTFRGFQFTGKTVLRGGIATDGSVGLLGQIVVDAPSVQVVTTGNLAIAVYGSLSGSGFGSNSLALNALGGGPVAINGSVGILNPLTSLTTTSLSETRFEGFTFSAALTDSLTINGPLRTQAAITISAPTLLVTGAVVAEDDFTIVAQQATFQSSIDTSSGSGVFSADVGVGLTFGGDVGAGQLFSNVVVNGAGVLQTQATPVTIRTQLSQTYNVTWQPQANITLVSPSSGFIRLSRVNSGHDLTIQTGGDVDLRGDIESVRSLSITADLANLINAVQINAGDSVSISADVVAQGGNAIFYAASAISIGGDIQLLSVPVFVLRTDTLILGGQIVVPPAQGSPAIAIEPFSLDRNVRVTDSPAAGELNIPASVLNAISSFPTQIVIGRAGHAGRIRFDAEITLATPLAITSDGAGGEIFIDQRLEAKSIVINGSGTTTSINADLFASGPVIINDAVSMLSGRRIDTTGDGLFPGAQVTITGPILAGSEGVSLVITAGAGVVQLRGGAGADFAPLFDLSLNAGLIELIGDFYAENVITFNAPMNLTEGPVTIFGSTINFVSPTAASFPLAATASSRLSIAGSISAASDVTLSAGSSGLLEINSTVQSSTNITILGGDGTLIVINSAVTAGGSLSVVAPDSTLRVDANLTAQAVSLTSGVTIGGDVSITLVGESSVAVFQGSLDARNGVTDNLSISGDAGARAVFNAIVGGSNPLGSILLAAAVGAEVNSPLVQVADTFDADSGLFVSSTASITAARLLVSGGVTGGGGALTLNISGEIQSGGLSGFQSIESTGSGTLRAVTQTFTAVTSGGQSWTGPVLIEVSGADATFLSTIGVLVFAADITLAESGAIAFNSSGGMTFNGLLSATAGAPGSAEFLGSGTAVFSLGTPFVNFAAVTLGSPAIIAPQTLAAVTLQALDLRVLEGAEFQNAVSVTLTGLSVLQGTLATTGSTPALIINSGTFSTDVGGSGGVSQLALFGATLEDINAEFALLELSSPFVSVTSEVTLAIPLTVRASVAVEVNAALVIATPATAGLLLDSVQVLLNAPVSTASSPINMIGQIIVGGAAIELDTTLAGASPAGANVSLLGDVRGVGFALNALSVNAGASGTIVFNGNVVESALLSSLTLIAESGIAFGPNTSSVLTTGTQEYFGPLTLDGEVSFGASSVRFAGTVNASESSVTIDAASDVTFDSDATFASLEVNARALLSGLISSTADQNWNGTIEVSESVTLRSGDGQIFISDVVGSNQSEDRDLSIESNVEVTLSGSISGLTTLRVMSADAVVFAGSLIEAVFEVEFLSPLLLPTVQGSRTIVSLAGSITFSDVSVGADSLLAIRADEIELLGAFLASSEGGVRVTFAPSSPGLNINLGASLGGEATLDFTAAELALLAGNFESVTFGSPTGSGAVRVLGTLNLNFPVVLSSPAVGGSFIVNQDIRMVGAGSISFIGSGATLFLNADIVTQGTPIVINDSVVIGANVTLDTTDNALFAGGANITITGTVNSSVPDQFSLTLVAGFGTISLQSQVGANAALASLSSDALNTEVSGSVITAGNQVYNSAVVLLSDTTFSGLNLAFNSAIGGGGFAIVLNSPGVVSIAGGVSARSLLTDAGGQTEFSGLLINSSGDVIFNDPFIVIVGPTAIIGGTGTVRFASSVAAGSSGFTVTADEIDILGSFSGGGDLILQPFTLSRDVNIAGPSLEDAGELDLPDDELGNIQDGFNSVTYGSSGGSGGMDIFGGNYSDPTIFQMDGAGGSIRINARVTGSGNGGITIRGSNSTTEIFADIVTDGTPISILDSVIIAVPAVSIDSTNAGTFEGAQVMIAGRVNSAPAMGYSLSLSAGDADIVLEDAVGGESQGQLGTLTTDAGGRTRISGGLVRTLGNQIYNDRADVQTDAELIGSTATVFLNSGFSSGRFHFTVTADDFELEGAASGSGEFWVRPFTPSRDVNINVGLESATSLDIDSDESNSLDGGGFSSVTYGSGGGTGTFIINGYDASTSTNFLNGGVGGRTLVQSGITGTGNGGIGIRGSNSTTEFFADVVTQGAPITILDSVIIRKPTLMISSTGSGALGAPVLVSGFINSEPAMGYSLELDSGSGNATFGGPIGGGPGGELGTLDVGTQSGVINIDGGLVSTLGAQTYASDVNLGADLLVRTAGAPVTFDDDVTGAGLVVDTGTGPITVRGNVGSNESPLDAIVISDGTDRRFEGVVFVSDLVLTDGTVQFLSGATITRSGIVAAGLLTGVGDVTFQGTLNWTGGTINGDGRLVLDELSQTTIDGPGVKTLSRDLVVGGSAVWTQGDLAIDAIAITILESGTFELLVPYSFTELSQGNEIFNHGLFVKGGGGVTIINFPFNNLGEIRIDSGELQLLGGGNHQSLFNLAQPGTRLVLAGGHSGGEYDGVGTVSLLEPIARISAIGGVNFEFAPGSYSVGALRNAGDLVIPSGVQLRLERGGTARSLENRGVLELQSQAVVTLAGGFTTTAGATLRVFVAGPGVGEFGSVQADGVAVLNGSLFIEAVDGYVPMRFDNLRVVEASAGVQGTFASEAFPTSDDAALVTKIIYDAGAVRYLTTVRSDLTLDGRMDMGDFLAFFNAYDFPPQPEADVDGNGVVDFADFCYFFNEYDLYLE